MARISVVSGGVAAAVDDPSQAQRFPDPRYASRAGDDGIHVEGPAAKLTLNHGRGINLCATVTHMSDRVGVRQLRQNLSRYLDEVKSGSTLVVTERGREVARLVPSGVGDSVLGRLAAERGATLPTATLADVKPRRRAKGTPSREVLDELRGERL